MANIDDILKRLEGVERHNGEFAGAIGDLRDALTVTAEVQRRQAAVQLGQAEWLEHLQEGRELHERSLQRLREGQELHEVRMRHIDERLAEITDKLNGLIGYIDNMTRRQPPQPPPAA